MQYQLTINIDSIELNTIYNSGQAVTLVKSVTSNPLGSGNLPIAWVEFQPLQTNLVSWIENYYAYATTTVLQGGATIVMTSHTSTPVQTGWTYTLQNGQFNSASGGGTGVYTVANQMSSGNFSFGLSQQATVNGVSVAAPLPLNATAVLFNQDVYFQPSGTISIFLTSVSGNGVCIYQIPENALVLTLTSQSPTAEVGFNDQNNTFYLT